MDAVHCVPSPRIGCEPHPAICQPLCQPIVVESVSSSMGIVLVAPLPPVQWLFVFQVCMVKFEDSR